MQKPLDIVFRGMEPSPNLEDQIREYISRLEHLCPDIVSIRAVVEQQHKHHHQGALFDISLEVRVPGADLISNRSPDADHAHEDAYVALRDAYRALRRQLLDYDDRRHRKVKHHEIRSAP